MNPAVAQKFADETGIARALADRIMTAIYAKGLDAEKFNSVLWRLRSMIEKTKLLELLNQATDEEIEGIVTAISIEYDHMACSEDEHHLVMFSEYELTASEVKEGQEVEIQIMRTGKWQHPSYGEVVVEEETIDDVIENFESRARGIDLCVDENHDPNHVALGWFKKLEKRGKDALFAVIELTALGAEKLSKGAYKYFSPEIAFSKTDEESGKSFKNMLLGGAFTNRPFFKAMQPLALAASEDASGRHHEGESAFTSVLFTKHSTVMDKFFSLIAEYAPKGKLSADEVKKLDEAFAEISSPTAEVKKAFETMKAKFAEGEGAAAEGEKPKEGEGGENKPEGEKKPEGGEGGEKKVEASEKVISAAELSVLVEKANQGEAAFKELAELKTDKAVSALVFSESNKAGRFHSKDTAEVKSFMVSLNEDQRKKFAELVAKLPTISFGEIGSGENAAASGSAFAEIEAKIAEKRKDNKAMKYSDALTAVLTENAELAKRYEAENPAR